MMVRTSRPDRRCCCGQLAVRSSHSDKTHRFVRCPGRSSRQGRPLCPRRFPARSSCRFHPRPRDCQWTPATVRRDERSGAGARSFAAMTPDQFHRTVNWAALGELVYMGHKKSSLEASFLLGRFRRETVCAAPLRGRRIGRFKCVGVAGERTWRGCPCASPVTYTQRTADLEQARNLRAVHQFRFFD
jgi:hypothetical protein